MFYSIKSIDKDNNGTYNIEVHTITSMYMVYVTVEETTGEFTIKTMWKYLDDDNHCKKFIKRVMTKSIKRRK